MKTPICLAGASGHVGRELVNALSRETDLDLVACIGRKTAGNRLRDILGPSTPDLIVAANVREAYEMSPFRVLIDYTTPKAVFQTVVDAVSLNVHCVIGTSGLDDGDYAKLHQLALDRKTGIFAAGNFSVTAALLAHFAQFAARFVPQWELIDYGSDHKPDAPSGTSRELAHLLGQVPGHREGIPPRQVLGHPESRGANLNGTQVHSLRLPGYYSSSEAIFGLEGERLTLRHDSISYMPYVAGTLLAIRKVEHIRGLRRGMAFLLGLGD